MELALNLVWCAIVIASAIRFALWSRGQTGGRRAMVALATVCMLALLFPIISLTDDLHATATMAEDSSALRRIVSSATLLSHGLDSIAALALSPRIAPFALALVCEPVVATVALVLAGFGRVQTLRGPPSTQR